MIEFQKKCYFIIFETISLIVIDKIKLKLKKCQNLKSLKDYLS